MSIPDAHLLRVEKPARYIGGERGSVVKPAESVSLRFALCFPDVYEIAMSHLGSAILYSVLNGREGVQCERCHAPWPDYAELLREFGEPLQSLESHRPLREFDIAGFSLQTELCYPTVLSMLELGGVPIRSRERSEADPLILAGGPCCANPAPMEAFVDAFALGDGEESALVVCDSWSATRGLPREERLRALAELPGLWVPGYSTSAKAARLANLDEAPFPSEPIVPHIEAIHDRVSLEISRGCTQGCRFCQAGMLDRPVRRRSRETLLAQAETLLAATGHEEISLLSLSAADYPDIGLLCRALLERYAAGGVSLALPSTRVDAFSVSLAQLVASVRRGGITLAPEAGSQRLRDAINKRVTEEQVLEAAEAAYRAGFGLVKLYFMLGLPTETDEDAEAIGQLARRVAGLARGAKAKRGEAVSLSLAAFVPKPHTPFQWEEQASPETLDRRRRLVQESLRGERRVALHWHESEMARVECALARGGPEVAGAIERVWQLGARLEGWREWADPARWERAFTEAGLSLESAAAEIPADAPLPWDAIDMGPSRAFLLRERERARCGETLADCEAGRCHGCGVGCRHVG